MGREPRKPGIDVVRQVRNAVIAIDLEQRIVLWNSFAETLYQWKAEEALGRNIIELIVPDEGRSAAEEIIESLKETGRWDDEFVVRRSHLSRARRRVGSPRNEWRIDWFRRREHGHHSPQAVESGASGERGKVSFIHGSHAGLCVD